MIFWFLCAFIWFKNIEKMLLQMTSGFLQREFMMHMAALQSVKFYHEFKQLKNYNNELLYYSLCSMLQFILFISTKYIEIRRLLVNNKFN
jgi:hypothetical protein